MSDNVFDSFMNPTNAYKFKQIEITKAIMRVQLNKSNLGE